MELSFDHKVVVDCIGWQWKLLDRPGKPKCVERVSLEHLSEPPVRQIFNSHLRRGFLLILRLCT